MRPTLASVLVVSLLVTSARAQTAAEPPRTISTTGTATIYVVPDEADVRFAVQTSDADLAKAKAANDAAADEVLAYLKSEGIDAKDVQTGTVTSGAIYGNATSPDGRAIRGPVVAYEVSRQYALKLRDVSKLNAIYDRLLPDARVTLQGHALNTSESRKHRDQARTDAARAAREKAELLAGALGMRVGAPRTISEHANDYPQPMAMQNSTRFAGGAMDGGGGADVTPVGQIEVRAEVSVTFDLTAADALP